MNYRTPLVCLALVSSLFVVGCSDTPDGTNNQATNNDGTNNATANNTANNSDNATNADAGNNTATEDAGAGDDAGTSSDAGGEDAGGNADMGGADAGATACQESPNGEHTPTDTCQHGAADWIAWKWVPAQDITVDSISMHTSEGSGALFDDDNGKPGSVLFEGTLSAADADGWRTFEASTPVSLTGGSTYWLGENVLVCSVADDGTEWEYWTSDATSGPWNGPFMAHSFTARIDGTCP